MNTLFTDLSLPAGFRLHHFEVLNWGTFDEIIHRVEVFGQTTLLTGANGAGKTTLVDGLLTLLTPPGRFYNQSSGTESRQDRNEKTYVLGHYGRSAQEGHLETRADALRRPGCHSVLLACFRDERGGHALTLAQVRRFLPQGGLKVDFLVIPHALGIANLGALDGAGDWKRRVKREYPAVGPIFFDSFKEYGDALRRALGMRDKALTLFGKAVSLKVLGQLDKFIREHMLEPGLAEDDFRKLQGQYQQLLESHQALEKATEQLRQLDPLPAGAARLRQAEARLTELKDVRDAVQYLLTQREQAALEDVFDRRADDLATLTHQLEKQAAELSANRQRENELRQSIQQDDSSRQLELLDAELDKLKSQLADQNAQQTSYNALAAHLRLPACPADAASFEMQRENINDLFAEADAMLGVSDADLARQLALTTLTARRDELSQEVSRLANRPPTNIPKRELDLRARLCQQLRISPEELPFVGELLRVREDAADWEPALERLLNRFALQLLVPEPYYAALTAYVNATNLRGLLVYQRLAPEGLALGGTRQTTTAVPPAPRTVVTKLDLHPDSPHRAWLEQQLRARFPHICADNEAELQRLDQALTREGLVRNRNEHRKDDRPGHATPADYVLGWESAGKLQRYRELLQATSTELQQAQQAQERHHRAQLIQKANRDHLRDLSRFDQFEKLDAATTTVTIERRRHDRHELLHSPGAEQLHRLTEELDKLEARTKFVGLERERDLKRSGGIETQLKDLRERLEDCAEKLAKAAPPAIATVAAAAPYLPLAGSSVLSVAAVERARTDAFTTVDLEFGRVNKDYQTLKQTLVDAMRSFARPTTELSRRFPDWSGDVPSGTADLDALDDYLALHQRITQQELPQQRQKFEKYLREETADGIIAFRESLKSQARAIENYVLELNGSLKNITFNHQPAATYIRLMQRPTPNQRVRDFQQELTQAVPDQQKIKQDPAAQQQAFERVQHLLERLRSEPEWRQLVTDVREWSVFQAQEFFKTTDEPVPGKLYDGSGSLSGGEAAQLTYTVLVAALAYQFGLNRQQQGGAGGGRSFRFLVVDEAFSKLDPDKSRYLMELCKQMYLQVLVVTPDDKITVVEDFIAACHYVVCRDKKRSFVHNLPIEQYQALRQQFADGSMSEMAGLEIVSAKPLAVVPLPGTPLLN